VDETNVAYHAGNYSVNQISIGIEHEDNGNYNGVRPDTLYTASARLVRDICQYYNIAINRSAVRKHSEVTLSATGCPDALDIDRIVQEAAAQPPSNNLRVSTHGALKQQANHTCPPAIGTDGGPVMLDVGAAVVATGQMQATGRENWTELRLPAPSPVHGWFPTNYLTNA
jgi:hypothetical protein